MGLPAAQAVATTLLHIFLQSSNTTYLYYGKGQVAFKPLLKIIIPAIFSGQISTLILSYAGSSPWGSSPVWKSHSIADLMLFSLYSIIMALLIFFGFTRKKIFEQKKIPEPALLELVAIGSLAGFLSAILGIGGGFLLVPYLISRMQFSAPMAAAGSIFMILAVSLFSTLQYAYHGLIIWQFSIITAAGSLLGAIWGTTFVQDMEKNKFQKYFTGLQLIILIAYTFHFFLFP